MKAAILPALLVLASCADGGSAGGVRRLEPPIRITEPEQAGQVARGELARVRGVLAVVDRAPRVEVAVAHLDGTRCRWLTEAEAVRIPDELEKRFPNASFGPVQVFGPRPGDCKQPLWHRATVRQGSWDFRVDCPTARGNYRVLARAIAPGLRASDAVVFRVV